VGHPPPGRTGLIKPPGSEGREGIRLRERNEPVRIVRFADELPDLVEAPGNLLASDGSEPDGGLKERGAVPHLELLGEGGVELSERPSSVSSAEGRLCGVAEQPRAKAPPTEPLGNEDPLAADAERCPRIELRLEVGEVRVCAQQCRSEAFHVGELLPGPEDTESLDRATDVNEGGAAGDERVGDDRRKVGTLGRFENRVGDLDRPAKVVVEKVRRARWPPRAMPDESVVRSANSAVAGSRTPSASGLRLA